MLKYVSPVRPVSSALKYFSFEYDIAIVQLKRIWQFFRGEKNSDANLKNIQGCKKSTISDIIPYSSPGNLCRLAVLHK